MISRIFCILRLRGIGRLAFVVMSRVRGLLAGQAKSFQTYEYLFSRKEGLEIGGPSRTFAARGVFPVYPIVGTIDNCTFGNDTVWEGNIEEGRTYRFNRRKPAGLQYIAEATAMEKLPSVSYDFVLSSHVLEHVANPIRALTEWKRLLRQEGVLVMLLPDGRKTFDHRRPVTTLAHLITDFEADTKEDDLTHLSEILALHDLTRDPGAGDATVFRSRSLQNLRNRCLHHHVFDIHLAADLAEYMGLEVKAVEAIQPHHILLVAKKPSQTIP